MLDTYYAKLTLDANDLNQFNVSKHKVISELLALGLRYANHYGLDLVDTTSEDGARLHIIFKLKAGETLPPLTEDLRRDIEKIHEVEDEIINPKD